VALLCFTRQGYRWRSSHCIDGSDDQPRKCLEKAIGPYLEKAQRIGRRTSRPSSPSTYVGQVDTKAVRAWAASNGIEVSNRRRVPADVIDKYKAAGH
jgi:hypothetical protein